LPVHGSGGHPLTDEELDRLESFRAFINRAEEGADIPTVANDDLKALHELSVDMAKRRVAGELLFRP
jgi:hypothetical protein